VLLWNNRTVAWAVEFTDEFEDWWNNLGEPEQIKVDATIRMLEEYGPDLPYPMSSGVSGSRHSHMRELRVQIQGKPYRVPGNERWYEIHIPKADKLYDQHLEELNKESKKEGSRHGGEV
jgi:hypothetical protein